MKGLSDIIKQNPLVMDKRRYISLEWQEYAYRLALELEDLPHRSLYMRLAKTHDRALLETARLFVHGRQANSKAKLFMWKLKNIKDMMKNNAAEKDKSTG